MKASLRGLLGLVVVAGVACLWWAIGGLVQPALNCSVCGAIGGRIIGMFVGALTIALGCMALYGLYSLVRAVAESHGVEVMVDTITGFADRPGFFRKKGPTPPTDSPRYNFTIKTWALDEQQPLPAQAPEPPAPPMPKLSDLVAGLQQSDGSRIKEFLN
jgi:hypothetical protein